MKHAVNFRLSKQATTSLLLLARRLNTSKIAIVKKALDLYAKKHFIAYKGKK